MEHYGFGSAATAIAKAKADDRRLSNLTAAQLRHSQRKANRPSSPASSRRTSKRSGVQRKPGL